LDSVAIVGDITPSDGIPKAEKSRREQAALNEMCQVLGGGVRGMHFRAFPVYLYCVLLPVQSQADLIFSLQRMRLKNFGLSMKIILL